MATTKTSTQFDNEQSAAERDLHREAMIRYQNAFDFTRTNLDEAYRDLKFRQGDQWPEDAKQQREADQRPVLTINRMPQFVRQIANDIRLSQPAINVSASDDQADEDTAEVIGGLIRQIERHSDAHAAYFTAADSQVSCGIAHWRVAGRYVSDDTFVQDLVIEELKDPVNVLWDPNSYMLTREDALFCFVPEDMTREAFEKRFPGKSMSELQDSLINEITQTWYQTDMIRVSEYWVKEPITKQLALIQDEDGINRAIDVTDDKDEMYRSIAGFVRVEPRKSFKIMRYLLSGSEVLEPPLEWPGRYIPIVPLIGEEVRVGKEIYRHGAIRFARDPQQMYNFWRTAQTEFTALQPITPYLGTEKNFEVNKNEWAQANKRPKAFLTYTPDEENGGLPPERVSPVLPTQGMMEGVAIAAEDMKATTGIYDAGLGAQSNEISGRAINARTRQSDVSSYTYLEHFTRAIRHTGQILVDLIPHFYDTTRVVRVLGADGLENLVAINKPYINAEGKQVLYDMGVGKYDVVVEAGPSYTSKREQAAEGMAMILQSNPQLFMAIGDLFVKSQDWPMANEVAERINKIQQQEMPFLFEDEDGGEPQQPSPEQLAMIQARMAEMEADLRKKEADADKAESQADKAEFDAKAARTELLQLLAELNATLSLPGGEEFSVPVNGQDFLN